MAIAAIVVWLLGVFLHPLAVLAPLGVLLLLAAGVAYLMRPKSRSMYWRGRRIDLDEPGSGHHLYYVFFKR
jgi:hypothetical protein